MQSFHLHWTLRKSQGKEYKYYSLAHSYREGGKVRKKIITRLGLLASDEVTEWQMFLKASKEVAKKSGSYKNSFSSEDSRAMFKKHFTYESVDQNMDLSMMQEVLKHAFYEIPDPRKPDNLEYPFYGILLIVLAAMLASAKSITAIHEYAQQKASIFLPLLGIQKTPSYAAFWWVLTRSNSTQLNQTFIRWIKSVADALPKPLLNNIAVDGKTLRGTKLCPVHYVSAYDNTRGLLLGQYKTMEKSNEITAIPELLKIIDVKGALITIDAMGCQREICRHIRELGGDYCIALKGNQENLHDEAVNFFQQAREVEYEEVDCDRDISYDKGHGRIETREVTTTKGLTWLDCRNDWKDLAMLIEVRSTRSIKGKSTEECRYYISSRSMSAKEASQNIRSHWSIESMHWTLDVLFGDDIVQANRGHTAENLGLFRRMAYCLLKQETDQGRGLASEQRKAMWDENYILKILGKFIRQVSKGEELST